MDRRFWCWISKWISEKSQKQTLLRLRKILSGVQKNHSIEKKFHTFTQFKNLFFYYLTINSEKHKTITLEIDPTIT